MSHRNPAGHTTVKRLGSANFVLGQVQFAIGFLALAFDVAAIVYFADWIGKTDWLMGHVYGPASSILAAVRWASAGLIATVAWMVLALVRRFAGAKNSPQLSWRLVVQGAVLLLLLAPVGLIAAIGVSEIPHARRELQRQRMKASGRLPSSARGVSRAPC